MRVPVRVSNQSGCITKGHGQVLTAIAKGWGSVPVEYQDYDSDAAELADVLADNNLAKMARLSEEKLSVALVKLKQLGGDEKMAGFSEELLALVATSDPAAGGMDPRPENKKLSDRFLVPPFSVLDARQGYWQERKREWLGLGIRSEIGRGENLLGMSETVLEPDPEKRKQRRGAFSGIASWTAENTEMGSEALLAAESAMEPKQPANAHLSEKQQKALGFYASYGGAGTLERAGGSATGTSIFDPVICELAYRWFSPKGGKVLDPFAGGSVRGVVASHTGREYHGIELRAEQVEANRGQLEICHEPLPAWYQGDSAKKLDEFPSNQFDLLFSCPPYFDLEIYSDDPADISTMSWESFMHVYELIIYKAAEKLKENRFAVWVIGEVRDKQTGLYRNFVGETVRAFAKAGMALYNEAILVTSVGTLPIRAGRMFSGSRVLGKTHQNVLVFVKGDRNAAAEACGEVEIEGIVEAAAATAYGEKITADDLLPQA